ncbi:MAG: hypothetical protein H0W76_00805 [Pyrinomonadaceae bacterium]|nr:hypothetical protein [Pyrinomonadaceae bacterium]
MGFFRNVEEKGSAAASGGGLSNQERGGCGGGGVARETKAAAAQVAIRDRRATAGRLARAAPVYVWIKPKLPSLRL